MLSSEAGRKDLENPSIMQNPIIFSFAGGIYAALVRRQLQSGSSHQEKGKDGTGVANGKNGQSVEAKDLSRQSTGAIVDEVSRV